MTTATGYRFGTRGRPTGPDVDKIMAVLCMSGDKLDMPVGKVITQSEVSKVISESPDSSRFKAVAGAWRKRLFKLSNVLLESSNHQYTVLDGNSRAVLSGKTLVSGIKRFGMAGTIASSTDRTGITEESQRLLTHSVNVSASIRELYDREQRRLRFDVGEIRKIEKRN